VRAGRFLKRAGLILIIVLAVGALGIELARRYWLGPRVAREVARHLEEALGTPVRVGQAKVGYTDSSLHGLEFFEAGQGKNGTPWATVDEVQLDVAVTDLIKGRAKPTEVTITGARITLRFDSRGRLRTRLPPAKKGGVGRLPAIHLEQSQLTLRQEGRAHDLVLRGVDARLVREGERVELTGSMDDSEWKGWSVAARFDSDSGGGSLTLQTDRGYLDPDRLERLPFVPASVWQDLRARGDRPVGLTLLFDSKEQAVRYRVVLDKNRAR
jgi:hypothetical protein